METKSYLIAELPLKPDDSDKKPLVLKYTPTSELGIFYYGDQPLQLSYTTNEHSYYQDLRRAKINPTKYQIPCSTWITYFSDWQIEEDNLYCRSGKLDYESETERKCKYFSGFKFDDVTGVWRCTWETDDREMVFNSTFEYSDKIELVLNLLDAVGSYNEYRYADASS